MAKFTLHVSEREDREDEYQLKRKMLTWQDSSQLIGLCCQQLRPEGELSVELAPPTDRLAVPTGCLLCQLLPDREHGGRGEGTGGREEASRSSPTSLLYYSVKVKG